MAGKGMGRDDPQIKPLPPAQAEPRKPPGEHTTGRFFLPSSAPRYARRRGRMRREGNVPAVVAGKREGNWVLSKEASWGWRPPSPQTINGMSTASPVQGSQTQTQSCFSVCHPKARTDGCSPAPPQNRLKQRPRPLFHGIHRTQHTQKINSAARKPCHKRSKGFNALRGLGTQRSCSPLGALGTARGARSPPQPAARRSPAEVRLSLFLHYLQFVHRRH